MSDALVLRGELKGHGNWVTSLATTDADPTMLVSGSRDKSVIMWRMKYDGEEVGVAQRALRGHNHFVSDVTLSQDGAYCLSSSWDSTLRLWDLSTGETRQLFQGHKKDALSVAFSPDNRQIVSGSRDKSVKIWNTIGENKYSIENAHKDWVSCVRFSPQAATPVVVSAGWDNNVKVTSLSGSKASHTLEGHTGYVSTVTVSPDGSLCASGGKDGSALLWDLNEAKKLDTLDAGSPIHSLCFSPNRYWLCGATSKSIIIWDLESKQKVVELAYPNASGISEKALMPYATSIAWSADGSTLYSGYTDNVVRVWGVSSNI